MNPQAASRLVVVGRNAKMWPWVREHVGLPFIALGHGELGQADIAAGDVVWIFSYSRRAEENRALLQLLARSPARSFIYVSSATANIAAEHRCYSYPAAKFAAEGMAREILSARIVRLGVVYRRLDELPAGRTAATSAQAIAAAMDQTALAGSAAAAPEELFELLERPFASLAERLAHRTYGLLMAASPFPCLLRPLDALLRLCGWRWYGYLYLSNARWLATRS